MCTSPHLQLGLRGGDFLKERIHAVNLQRHTGARLLHAVKGYLPGFLVVLSFSQFFSFVRIFVAMTVNLMVL